MTYKPKSIVLNRRNFDRVYSTFADWQAKQLLDMRTPAQRGIGVGSQVMWRTLHNSIIVTDRATVLAVDGNTLTSQVKGVQERTSSANVREIVSNTEDRLALSLHEIDKRTDMRSTAEAALPAGVVL